jgi:isopentenyl-diphosphate delta-isomerase type 1
LTAETIFQDTLNWDVRSAGTEDGARIKVTAGHLGWADVIVVMEKRHKERLRQKYPERLAGKPCVCLCIADDYEFMAPELIAVLRSKMQEHFPEIRQADLQFMSDEIFDVVNEHDEVVGRAPRREVHRTGLMHRAIHVFVFNARGEVFLQKRSMSKDSSPGLWDSSASGHLDAGEDYDACAVRELREEIGLHVSETPRRVFKVGACAQTGQEFVWLYQTESEGPFTLHLEEIERGEWFTKERVSAWIKDRPQDFAPAFVLLWEKFVSAAPQL